MKPTRPLVLASTLTVAAAVVTLATSPNRQAQAYPAFAKKEGKPCTYCHPGQNKKIRNYRGAYYQAHSNSFTGFDDAAEAKKAGVEVGPEATPPPASQTPPAAGDKPAETPAEKPAEKPVEKPEEKKPTVAELTEKTKAAEAAYKAKPKDADAKKAYANALADLGHATMLDQAIAPRQRYPQALKQFNQALKLDPANKTALDDKKAIEDVYKSMGRPIPQG